jgi:hypothetical protein
MKKPVQQRSAMDHPMKRTGFAVKVYTTPPPAPPRRVERSGVIRRTDKTATSLPKEKLIISEAYRKLVRSLPCARCGHPGPNQFCHADEGKGISLKTDDRRGWPGCGPRGGYVGCHYLVGSSGMFTKRERRKLEAEYAHWTRVQILDAGAWPKSLPRWIEGEGSNRVKNGIGD